MNIYNHRVTESLSKLVTSSSGTQLMRAAPGLAAVGFFSDVYWTETDMLVENGGKQ